MRCGWIIRNQAVFTEKVARLLFFLAWALVTAYGFEGVDPDADL